MSKGRTTTVLVMPALLVCLTAAISCGDGARSQTSLPWPEQPNILWIVVEDIGPYLPAFGDDTIAMPSLGKLAAEGVRYPNLFSVSGVCAPSRAAIATGMYPTSIGAQHMRTGPWYTSPVSEEAIARAAREMPPGIFPYEAVPPPQVTMHSELLRRAGYYACNNAKEDYQFRKPVTAWDESSPHAHWRNRAPDQPFFAIVNLGVTHESQIWARAKKPLLVPEDLPVAVPPYLPDTEVVRRDLRRLYSNIIEMDRQVGEILEDLERDGLLEETIVFWYSDNGGPLPRGKRLLYDSGLNVPMIIRYPNGWHAGMVDDQLISFVDFLPTLLSLAGMPAPAHLQGQAFAGRYAAPRPRRYIHAAADRFDERTDTIRAVRSKRFKYLRNFHPEQGYYLPIAYREQMATMQELLRLNQAGKLDTIQAQWFRSSKPAEELFDLARDPFEVHDVAGDPAYAEALSELRAEYEHWAAATGDRPLQSEQALIEELWPGGRQPSTAAPVGSIAAGLLTLTSATPGASIGYQLLPPDAVPGPSWQVYTEPLALAPGQHCVALAHRLGFAPSQQVDVDVTGTPP